MGTPDDNTVDEQILRAIKSVRYGYVQIVVQDSKVVQIDKTEKIRLDGQVSPGQRGGERK